MGTLSVELDGVRIDAHSRESLFGAFVESISNPRDDVFVGFYAALLRAANENIAYKVALKNASVVYADGAGASLAIRVLSPGAPNERLATTDIWQDLIAICADLDVPVAIVGSGSESVEEFANRVRSLGASVVFWRHGYFESFEQRRAVASEVRRSGAGLVLVGMGAHVQEEFCREVIHSGAGAQTFVTTGGLADHVVGKTRRAPLFVQRTGFEWLWRTIQEPRRLVRRYAEGNSYFMYRLAGSAVRQAIGGSRTLARTRAGSTGLVEE